ncbi:MAG TPA: hypothetical protein VGH65_10310 [Verrucomicrobiaceae bacterium]|jgi:hypothetical protein
MKRLLRRCIAALACGVLLSSCLEGYDEEMVIYSDLSGRAVVKVNLPDAVLSKFDSVRDEFEPKKIQKRFASLSGVTLERYSLTEGRFAEATFEVSFSSLEKLNAAAAANQPAPMLVGEFVVTKDADGRTIVERKLGLGTATADLPADKYANYKMHFQEPVVVARTDSGFKDASHNDVRYRWKLADISIQKPTMVNKLAKPLPWAWILSGAAALLFGSWIVWLAMRQSSPAVVTRREDEEEA